MRASAWIAVIGVASFAFASCAERGDNGSNSAAGDEAAAAAGKRVVFYRSSMNPSFISTKPGKDAMGMDLVAVYEGDPAANLDAVQVDGATVQKMGVRTAAIEIGEVVRRVRAVGRIELDETRVSQVNMKFDGWIEQLWVNETGSFVKKGAPLFSVYSPELVASQEEYLQVLRANAGGPHSQHLREAARQRLAQFDVPDGFLASIERTRKASRRVALRAPDSGYVVHKAAYEGTFVKKGANLFTLADLDALWVIADVFESDAPWVHVGQDATVELDYLPGQIHEGKVDFVYPTLDPRSRTVSIRVVLPNKEVTLKPGMFATVRVHTVPAQRVLRVPTEAVIHSGERNTVFVSLGAGRFAPRDLQLGALGDDFYEVDRGLSQGEQVVVSGQFLLDSESRLKEALNKMLGANVQIPAAPSPTADTMSHGGHDAGATD